MDDIAAEAGTSRTVVHRHFADSSQLYDAVCSEVAGRLLAELRTAMRSSTHPHGMTAAAVPALPVTLVDGFAIPAHWTAAAILKEEAGRREAMAARDAELRAQNGEITPEGTATAVDAHYPELIIVSVHATRRDTPPRRAWRR
jgi:AcrR family transcriptional regulator